jgi:hypothetical protein
MRKIARAEKYIGPCPCECGLIIEANACYYYQSEPGELPGGYGLGIIVDVIESPIRTTFERYYYGRWN